MKKVMFLILLSIAFHSLVWADTPKELFESGVLLFKQGQYQAAVDTFTQLIKQVPENADAYKNRGVSYMKLERFDLAIKDFETAKKLFPELKGLYSNLGVAWYYKQDYEKAIENYDTEIQMASENHVAYFNRALSLAELGRNQEALDDLTKTLVLKPDFYWALCYKADLLAQTGEDIKALEVYDDAIRQNPKDTYSQEKRAQLKEKMKEKKVLVAADGPIQPLQLQPKGKEDAAPVAAYVNKQPVQLKQKRQKKNSPEQLNNIPKTDKDKDLKYTLQVGAFLNQANASKLSDRLLRNGFDSRILTLTDSRNRTWYLVRFGHYATQDEAKTAMGSLMDALALTSVVRFMGGW